MEPFPAVAPGAASGTATGADAGTTPPPSPATGPASEHAAGHDGATAADGRRRGTRADASAADGGLGWGILLALGLAGTLALLVVLRRRGGASPTARVPHAGAR